MIAVAVRALCGSIEDEARELARELGVVVYDARLKLSQPPPMIVLRTSDASAAQTLGVSLHARGHDVVVIDEAHVADPIAVRAFEFRDASFEASNDSIAYVQIAMLVRASHTTRTETIERVTERKLRPGAAIATGGLVMSKKVTRDEKRISQDREELLYIFSATRAPWLVAERSTSYASLDSVAASQRENFLRVVSELRRRAPGAAYDERLLAHKHLDALEAITLRAQILAISRR